jgi:hypothetical protein
MKQPKLKTITLIALVMMYSLSIISQNHDLTISIPNKALNNTKAYVYLTITEENCAENATLNVDMNSGDRFKINKSANGLCEIFTTNYQLIAALSLSYYGFSPFYNDTMFYVFRGTNTVTININVIGGTGVEEVSETKYFNLFPNPAKELINIKTENPTEFEILDVAGRLIMIVQPGEKSVDISMLEPGQYFVRGNGILRKFVKE